MHICYVFENGESEEYELPEYKRSWIICEPAWLVESTLFDGDKTAGDYRTQIKKENLKNMEREYVITFILVIIMLAVVNRNGMLKLLE